MQYGKNSSLVISITIASLTLLFTSNLVQAEIYKWRNARGVMQYSDTPPMTGATKVPRSELVNAIQKKDLCSISPVAAGAKKSNLMASVMLGAQTLGNRVNDKIATFGIGTIGTGFNLAATNSFQPRNSTVGQRFDNGVTTFRISETKPKNSLNTGNNTKPSNSNGLISPAASNSKPPPTAQPLPKPQTVATPTPAPTAPPVVVANAGPLPTLPSASTDAPSNIVQKDLMPAVDISKNITPKIGHANLRIQSTAEKAIISSGAFRVVCSPSHMSNDDPLVYPNQPGAAHHHTFYGNTSIDYNSNLSTLPSTGNSTCDGGTMNRSAYWAPSMIDTATNTPIADKAIFYYKVGFYLSAKSITAPPKGLKMIAGNAKATNETSSQATKYTCIDPITANSNGMPWMKQIPNCKVGDTMQMHIEFPQCWDGINLDSPDHKSHMAYPTSSACPASHPVAIPAITVNFNYLITKANQTKTWRLASDNYAFNGANAGYSGHADWVNGWDPEIMAGIVKNCINTDKDCHAHLLGDGRMYF